MDASSDTHLTPDQLWHKAKPAAALLYEMTDSAEFEAHAEIREQVRRGMASTMSCLCDAAQDEDPSMTGVYLAGACRMMQAVLQGLCSALERECISDEAYTRLFGECGEICTRAHETLFALPKSSRNTISMDSYAELFLEDQGDRCA